VTQPGLYRAYTSRPARRRRHRPSAKWADEGRCDPDRTGRHQASPRGGHRHCSDGPKWEELACRALAAPPPYRPVPGTPIYHVRLDGDRQVLVAEHDLCGALLDLVIAVLAMGSEA
jgi:hypothetical protein